MKKYTKPLFLRISFISMLALGIAGCEKSVEATSTPMSGEKIIGENSSGETIKTSDLDIATNVKSALMKDAAVGVFDITVIVSDGDVKLSGYVDNAAQLEQALNLARSIEGVRTVHNELKIREEDATTTP